MSWILASYLFILYQQRCNFGLQRDLDKLYTNDYSLNRSIEVKQAVYK